jgi:hypothetical protein
MIRGSRRNGRLDPQIIGAGHRRVRFPPKVQAVEGDTARTAVVIRSEMR